MKRFLCALLAALMLTACASAFAEAAGFEELGLAFDFSEIEAKSANYPYLLNYGVVDQEPFMSYMKVVFYNMPRNVVETIVNILENTEDRAEYEDYSELLNAFSATSADIVVTNAKTLAEMGVREPLPEGCELTEFGTLGDYHYYYLTYPADKLLSVYDEAEDTGDYEVPPQEMKAATIADIRTIQSELLKQLQAAELFEPVNKDKDFVGRTVDFESVDLDGNAVRSADLFKANKITMINVWGTWCGNCMNEMGALAEIHKRLQEKGCGIVGVEYEREPIDAVADTARRVFAENGITYPNVVMPESNPVLGEISNYPFTMFVDGEGRILTYPIKGAAVDDYEAAVDKLLAGEALEKSPDGGATANESGEYRVIVYDDEGSPVKGVIVQFCDESSCSFQKTKADGVAVFRVEEQKIYDVHVGKVPAGYVNSDETYKTLDTYSDVNIFISKAE